MSKKLLMNNYSENGLTPITDGLVCWLDGRDYDGGEVVKDRVNKKRFIVSDVTSTGYSFLYNKNTSVMTTTFNVGEAMYDLFNSDFTLCFVEKLSKVVSGYTYPRLINFNEYETNSPYQLIYQPDPDKRSMQFCDSQLQTHSVFKNIDICNDISKKILFLQNVETK